LVGVAIAGRQVWSDAGPVIEGQWGCTVPTGPGGCGPDWPINVCPPEWECCRIAHYNSGGCIIGVAVACCPNRDTGRHGRWRDGVLYTLCGGPDDDPCEDGKNGTGIAG